MNFPFEMNDIEYRMLCDDLPFFGGNFLIKNNKLSFTKFIGEKYEALQCFEYKSAYDLHKLDYSPFKKINMMKL